MSDELHIFDVIVHGEFTTTITAEATDKFCAFDHVYDIIFDLDFKPFYEGGDDG